MALDFTQLANEVDANDTVDGSASVLLSQLTQMIADLKNSVSDPQAQAQIQAFADRLAAARGTLALAVTNNTPSQTPPAPVGSSTSVDQQQAAARAARAQTLGGQGGTPRPQ